MYNCNCRGKYSCVDFAVAASIIIGIIAGILRFIGTITVTPAFLWVLFGIAVVYLAVVYFKQDAICCCERTPITLLLIGILGTILTSVILLGITFAATSVLGAIITGALLSFFTLTIASTACVILCGRRLCDED